MTQVGKCGLWVMLAVCVAALAAGCSKESDGQKLIDAARAGDVAVCDRLVQGGVPVDAADGEGNTALIWAVYYCEAGVVRRLVDLGANVNHANQRSYTPLICTVTTLRGHKLRGTQEQRNEIARLLIARGADVNRAIDSGDTALHRAAIDKNASLV